MAADRSHRGGIELPGGLTLAHNKDVGLLSRPGHPAPPTPRPARPSCWRSLRVLPFGDVIVERERERERPPKSSVTVRVDDLFLLLPFYVDEYSDSDAIK